MKFFLILTTLLIASASEASELTLGMPNTICEGKGRIVNKGAPDFEFTSKRSFYDGFIHIKNSINVLGLKLSSSTGLVLKQSGSSTHVYDMSILEGDFFKKTGNASCTDGSCTIAASAKAGDLILRETIIPTEKGFEVRNGQQKFHGIVGTYSASYTCKPLVARPVLPKLIIELVEKVTKTTQNQ